MARSREEMREYMREYRARKKAEAGPKPVAAVRSIRSAPSVESGSVLAAVVEELEGLPLAARRPADAAAARVMAAILDDESSRPQQAQASRRLSELMDGLRQEAEGGKSRLAALRTVRSEGSRGA